MPTVDQIDRGLVLRVDGSKPHCLVVEVELGEAGNDAGDDLGGRRSSGEDEPEAMGHGEARGVVRQVPGDVVSVVTRSESSLRACGNGGDMAGEAELSVMMANGVRGQLERRG